jgi:hypothetical protein
MDVKVMTGKLFHPLKTKVLQKAAQFFINAGDIENRGEQDHRSFLLCERSRQRRTSTSGKVSR